MYGQIQRRIPSGISDSRRWFNIALYTALRTFPANTLKTVSINENEWIAERLILDVRDLYPYNSNNTEALGRWISTQRSQYKLYQAGEPSLMTAERIRMLEEIGFCWDMMMMKRSATKVEVSKFNANRRGVSV